MNTKIISRQIEHLHLSEYGPGGSNSVSSRAYTIEFKGQKARSAKFTGCAIKRDSGEMAAGALHTAGMFSRNHSTVCLRALVHPCHFSSPHLFLPARTVILLTKFKLVDNSENSKKVKRTDQPYCIKLPKNNKVGKFGDVIKIAHLGKVHNALIISNRKMSKQLPRYDHHNIILLNEKKEPVGTRIRGPVPSALRKNGQHSKVVAMASRFI